LARRIAPGYENRLPSLERHGVSGRMLQTKRFGYIVHQGESQIVAEPFYDTVS